MAAKIPTTEPLTITPGDTVKWTKYLPDYPPADGWALSYELSDGTLVKTINATADGINHLVTLTASDSAGLQSGFCAWRSRVTKSGEVYTVGQGRFDVAIPFEVGTDQRSRARRALEAIEATLEGRASSSTESYEIQTPGGGMRKLKYIPVPELLTLRDRYRADVAREDAAARVAAGLPNPGRIYVRHV